MGSASFSATDNEAILNAVMQSLGQSLGQAPDLCAQADKAGNPPGNGNMDAGWPAAEPRPALWHLPGFGRKTRIRTTFGDLPIEVLRVGDQLCTVDGRIVRVAWVEQIALDSAFLERNASAQPVLIRGDTIDHGKPLRDLLVSPRQELAYGLSNFNARFRTAGTISGRAQIGRTVVQSITYYLFHCGEPVVCYAEGVPVRVAPLPQGTLFSMDEEPEG